MRVKESFQRKANAYRVEAARENFRVLEDAYQELDRTGGLSRATRGRLQTVNKADIDNYLAMARAYNETGVMDVDSYAAASIPFPRVGAEAFIPSPAQPPAAAPFVPPATQPASAAPPTAYEKYSAGFQPGELQRYAAQGAAVENPSWWGAKGGGGPSIFGWQPFGKEVENKVTFYLDNTKAGGEEAYEYLTEEEASLYNALLAKDGEEGTGRSDEYLAEMKPILSARKMGALEAQAAQDAENHPVLSSVGSVALAVPKGMGYLYSAGKQIAGQEVDPNDPRFLASRAQQAVRGTVAADIQAGAGSGALGNAASFLYGTGMSIADFLLAAGLTGGMGKAGEAASLAIMGTGAAGDTALSAFDRGATQEQALAAGFFAGAAEIVFEKFSLEHFIKLTNPGVRGAFAKNALKQAGIEASEEVLTEIANQISDTAVLGDLSEYNLAVQGYMAQGLTEAEAKQRAIRDAAGQVGLAALGGALSGGVTGSVGSAVGKIRGALAEGSAQAQQAAPVMEADGQAAATPIVQADGQAAAAPIQAAEPSLAQAAPEPDGTAIPTDAWRQAVSPEAITRNRAALGGMEPVAALTGKEFPMGGKDIVEKVTAFFDSLGNRVNNPILGDVFLKRRGVKSSFAHGMGPAKAAAFAAVPRVIERGTVIDYQENWKGRGYDTVIIAAPVDIGGEKSHVGAVLIRENGTQRYYLHEVLQQKGTSTPILTGTAKTGSTPSGAKVPSIINILEESLAVNLPGEGTQQKGASTPFKTGTTEGGSVPGGMEPPLFNNITEESLGVNRPDAPAGRAPSSGTDTGAGQGKMPVVPPIPGQVAVKDLGSKVRAYKNAHEADFVARMGEALQIPEAQRPQIRARLAALGMEVIQTGTLGEADKQALFREMYQGGSEPGTPPWNGAYLQFENALFSLRKKLNLAQRYEARQTALKNQRAEQKLLAEQMPAVREAYAREKELRAALERAEGVLTDADKALVTAIQGGSITLDQVKDRNDFDQLKAYLAAKIAYDGNREIRNAYNKQRRDGLFQQAMDAIDDSDQWRDKKLGASYMFQTQERNQRDINKNEASAALVNETYFAPVHGNEAQKTKLINRLAQRMKSTGLNQYEQQAAQMLHEIGDLAARLPASRQGERAMYEAALETVTAQYKALKAKHGSQINEGKARAALPVAYEIYDELFQAMNEAYIRNGYAPIPYRKNYLPHFFSGVKDPVTAKICEYLGIQYIGDELPTDIAGLTGAFRPGRVWNGHALEREGTATQYGLYEGFDSYVRTAGDVIFHTEDIQRLRALENALRYKYSDEGVRARIREIQGDTTLTPEEKQERIGALPFHNTHLSNYVQNLNEYTNLLAGKKSVHDRGPENALGRKLYSVMNAVQGRVSANMIAGNLSVAASNLVPLTQALGEVKPKTLLGAMGETIKGYAHSDGFPEQSAFLTNRRGAEQAYGTALDRANEALSKPFEMVDTFVADTLVRAKYAENLEAGMEAGEALHQADAWAAGLMADRSKGALPTAFGIRNPLVKAFTMFQVETNNQLGYLFKDLPRNLREKGLGAIAAALFRVFLGAWLYNELDARVTGNRRALDPLHIVQEAVEGAGDVRAGQRKASEVALETWENIADTIPFAGSYLGGSGGRLPAASGFPNLWEIGKAALDGEGNLGATALEELKKPAAYLLPPFGGGQLKKTIEGIEVVGKGGAFKTDREGRERLQFETEQGPLDYAQAALFGKWALPQARAYVEAGFPLLSAKDTAAWRAWQESGRDGTELLRYRDRFRALTPLRDEAGDVVKSVPAQQRELLFQDEALGPEDKALLDALLIADGGGAKDYRSKAWFNLSCMPGNAYQDAQAAEGRGIPPEAYLAYLSATKGLKADTDANGNPIPGSKRAKALGAIRGLGLTVAQQKWLAEQAGYKWE